MIPNYEALRREYDRAILEIQAARDNQQLTTPFYRQVGDSIFDAGCRALGDYSSNTARMHVVSAPMGAGKTSFSMALAVALTRVAEADPSVPYGCLFVVDQRTKADELWKELNGLLPGQVAVWTSDHDSKATKREKVLEPSATFSKEALKDYPVAIVTHRFYSGKGGEKARLVLREGQEHPRALTLVDEQPEQVNAYVVEPSQVGAALEAVRKDEDLRDSIIVRLKALKSFVNAKEDEGGASIEKPSDDPIGWSFGNQMRWFATEEAERYARRFGSESVVSLVFGFAKALANNYAFITRYGSGEVYFIGYEQNLIHRPGMVLLDATADIDGVQQLSPWMHMGTAPQARYDNLSIVHVPSVTRQGKKRPRLGRYLRHASNRREYTTWMHEVIRAQMQPGQKGLVVCKLALFENENVPVASGFDWDLDGRFLATTHWGTGIGSNAWQQADVVFLFDEFYQPRYHFIATAQGLQGHKATEGALATMRTLNNKAPAVQQMMEGHLLRWSKQLALRGKGRHFDGNGVCGVQKLVCTGDYQRLLLNHDRLFPGAELPKSTVADSADGYRECLVEILSRSGLPHKLTSKWVADQMGLRLGKEVKWRSISTGIMPLDTTKRLIATLGWRYVSQRGRGGSRFQRVTEAPLKMLEAA